MDTPPSTRDRVVSAAADLFYGDGIRAVSMDAIAVAAGVTKRTLYYHFQSKDDLVAAYLDERDQPNLDRFARWFRSGESAEEGIKTLFGQLAKAAKNRKWNGCGFLRTSAELANMPGHPAMQVARQHKKKVEAWLTDECRRAGCINPEAVGRQIMILLDGAFATVLMHRDPRYMDAAGEAAAALIGLARPAASEKDI